MKNSQILLGVGNKGANISECHDEEGKCLDEKVDEVVVLPEHNIVAATEEEVKSHTKFQQVNPNDIWRQRQQM